MVRQFSARHYRPLLPSSILIANLIQSLSSLTNADPLFTAAVFALYVAAVWIIPRLTPIPALLSIFASLWLSASLLWIVSGHEQGSALFNGLFNRLCLFKASGKAINDIRCVFGHIQQLAGL